MIEMKIQKSNEKFNETLAVHEIYSQNKKKNHQNYRLQVRDDQLEHYTFHLLFVIEMIFSS